MHKGPGVGRAWFVQETVRGSMSERAREQKTPRDYVFSLSTKTLSKMGISQGLGDKGNAGDPD